MKKVASALVTCAAINSAFADPGGKPCPATCNLQPASQSLSFVGPSTWNPGTTVNIDAFLTISGLSAFGLSYWLEAPTALAPYLSITGVQYFIFTDPNATLPNPAHFNQSSGALPGYLIESRDLGGFVPKPNHGNEVPPGSYYITRITFAVDSGACVLSGQTFTMRSTTTNPRASFVIDSSLNDNNIPAATYSITIGSPPCEVVSQVSRKTHDAAGTFDVDLPLSGTPGIECRMGGSTNDYTIVVTFSGTVAVNGNPQAAVTLGTGTIGTDGNSNGGMVIVSGNTVTVPLTNIANAQTINVTLNGVNYGNGNINLVIPMSLLVGDTNANGTVNSTDIVRTKAHLGQTLTQSNFRDDVTAGGSINATDVATVKASLQTALP